jgi:hypothetical protein
VSRLTLVVEFDRVLIKTEPGEGNGRLGGCDSKETRLDSISTLVSKVSSRVQSLAGGGINLAEKRRKIVIRVRYENMVGVREQVALSRFIGDSRRNEKNRLRSGGCDVDRLHTRYGWEVDIFANFGRGFGDEPDRFLRRFSLGDY